MVAGAKVAVTARLLDNVTVQVEVPGQVTPRPLHPVKTKPCAGVALNVSCVPPETCAEQLVPQLIPPGFEMTDPAPFTMTVRVTEGRGVVKAAVTSVSEVRVSVQVVVDTPAQASCHPLNRSVENGIADKMIVVPEG